MKLYVALVFVLGMIILDVSARNDYPSEALKDEIVGLPDAPPVKFRMFSGYIPVNAAGTRKLFYWFYESQRDSVNDPLFLWTNGGPGCSGLIGAFTELGPFEPTKDGKLKLRQYSWNLLANFIFIEQPAGVGFSQPERQGIPFGDASATADNLAFITGWLERFSNYKKSSFFISSESYGGHYIPLLAQALVTKAPSVNFKGFAVGNPLTYMPFRDFGEIGTYAYHQMIPKPEFDAYVSQGCAPDPQAPATNPPPPRPAACYNWENVFSKYMRGTDPYAIDFPVCTEAASAGRAERAHFLRRARLASIMARSNYTTKMLPEMEQAILKDYFPEDYQPCESNWMKSYLNRADVQAAVHAQKPFSAGVWDECSRINFSQFDEITAMMPVYKNLVDLKNGTLRMLVYSGDNDSICATLESQLWIWNMKLPVVEPWQSWHSDQQVAGYRVRFSGLHFATVHGAGHMVPTTRPMQAFQMLTNFLTDKWA